MCWSSTSLRRGHVLALETHSCRRLSRAGEPKGQTGWSSWGELVLDGFELSSMLLNLLAQVRLLVSERFCSVFPGLVKVVSPVLGLCLEKLLDLVNLL